MRIISTQIPDQSEKLKALLGNEVELRNIPMIKIKIEEANTQIVNTIEKVPMYNWLVFTSIRGVQCFFMLYEKTGYKKEDLDNLKFACIGESTNKELEKYGFDSTCINPGNTSRDFANYLVESVLKKNDKVFLPLGNRANNYLPNKLTEFCKVTRVNVYRTEGVDTIDSSIIEIIKKSDYDFLVFTSPSAVDNFINLTALKPEHYELKIASIGATTNEAMKKYGYKPLLTASKSNLKTLANEIIEYLK